jgi:hypothetical protein
MNKSKNKLLISLISVVLLITISRVTSFTLRAFPDELVSLTANTGFFTNFDFRAGTYLLGNQGYSYSVLNSSGPLSAVGSSVVWIITKDLYLSRLFNFVFVLILNVFLSNKICTHFKLDFKYVVLSNLFLITIPWWYGILYSLGELPSIILFFYALMMFNKKRVLSILLISFSIFFSKLILLLFFGGFYSFYIFGDILINKKINLTIYIKDLLAFITPLSLWLLIVFLYSDFGVAQYFDDIVNYLILNHQSSDTASMTSFSFLKTLSVIQDMKWAAADVYKVLIFPIYTMIILFINKKTLIKRLNLEFYGLIGSISVFYLWFWVLSTTKWIKYSSQMIYLCLYILLLLLLSISDDKNKIKKHLISISLIPFVSSVSLLVLSIPLLIYSFKKDKYLINILIFIFILSGLNSLYETRYKDFFQINMINCEEQLLNNSCKEEYLGY